MFKNVLAGMVPGAQKFLLDTLHLRGLVRILLLLDSHTGVTDITITCPSLPDIATSTEIVSLDFSGNLHFIGLTLINKTKSSQSEHGKQVNRQKPSISTANHHASSALPASRQDPYRIEDTEYLHWQRSVLRSSRYIPLLWDFCPFA